MSDDYSGYSESEEAANQTAVSNRVILVIPIANFVVMYILHYILLFYQLGYKNVVG